MAKKVVFNRYTSVPPQDEHEFQRYSHEWFKRCYPDVIGYAVPNGAKLPGRRVPKKDSKGKVIYNEKGEQKTKRVSFEAMKLLREGLLPGAADYFIAKPMQTDLTKSGWYHGLYIEFKFGDNEQSENQITFERNVVNEDYYYVCVWDNRTVADANGAIDPLLNFKQVVFNYFKEY